MVIMGVEFRFQCVLSKHKCIKLNSCTGPGQVIITKEWKGDEDRAQYRQLP